MTRTYTIAQAARELQARWTNITERQLRLYLLQQRLICRDRDGHHIATARADARYIKTEHGWHRHPMPGNPWHQRQHATAKITEAGIRWLDEQLTAAMVAA